MLLLKRTYYFYIIDTELRCVILRARFSYFWRHQKNSPRWYLATIESIHQFLVELHICALGIEKDYQHSLNYFSIYSKDTEKDAYMVTNSKEIMQKYNGQYDNLLYFFKYMFEHIRNVYSKPRVDNNKSLNFFN